MRTRRRSSSETAATRIQMIRNFFIYFFIRSSWFRYRNFHIMYSVRTDYSCSRRLLSHINKTEPKIPPSCIPIQSVDYKHSHIDPFSDFHRRFDVAKGVTRRCWKIEGAVTSSGLLSLRTVPLDTSTSSLKEILLEPFRKNYLDVNL